MAVKRIDENGKEKVYGTLKLAAQDVPSKLETWKIELYIAYAITSRTKAFKSKWMMAK